MFKFYLPAVSADKDVGEGKLYQEQFDQYYKVHEWLSIGDSPAFILRGPAGTGKTHLVKYLLSNHLRKYMDSVALCAPTNQAVKVLKSLSTGCDCLTVYSLLGLRMEEHEDTLRLEKADRSSDGNYKLIVVDEASMVGEDLLGFIKESIARGLRYLFIGDTDQINPVGESKSLVWNLFPGTKLTKVIRHDNQILKLATHIRSVKNVHDLNLQNDNDRREGVWCTSARKFESKVLKYARLGLFENESRVIAWRNRTVDHFNSLIRSAIFGKETAEANQWIAGDHIVFISPFETREHAIKIFTDDEALVESVVVGPHTEFAFLQCYYLTLLLYDGRKVTVKTIHESSQKAFDSALTSYANDARGGKKELWRAYWALRNSVVRIKHAFAITAHRSQGSSRRNVFVVADDILANTNRIEAKRCLYTAVTRATTKVFIR